MLTNDQKCSQRKYVWLFIYGCSFVAKRSWKKKTFFVKIFAFLQSIHFFAEKMFLHGKKLIMKKFFCWKKTFFYREKLYLISEICFYTENIFVTNKI